MTEPFGPVLENSIKEPIQGGRLSMIKGSVVHPQFFCCSSGTSVGVAKDPVAVMSVSPVRACTLTATNVIYSLSWAPSSTINRWDIDWGDGNTSFAVDPPPPAGNVNHPGGGYALPGTYTITLTVTDVAGGIGYTQMQVEALDCTVGPPIELIGGCGSSGVWYTANAGLNWDDISGVLAGVQVYDVKANLFTLGTERLTLWAATANGLYSKLANTEWKQSVLPSPPGYPGVTPIPATVTCSKYAPTELYVLAYSGTVTWVYRSIDNGVTWPESSIVRIGADSIVLEQATSVICGISYLSHINETLYSFETAGLGCCSALRRRNADGTWTTIAAGRPANSEVLAATDDDEYIYACGTTNCNPLVGNKATYVIGSSWSASDTGVLGNYYGIEKVGSVLYCASCEPGPIYDVDKLSVGGGILDTIANPAGWHVTRLGQLDNVLYASFTDGTDHRIYRLSGTTWVLEDTHLGGNYNEFAEYDDKLYASYSTTPYIRVRIGGEWQDDDEQIVNSAHLNIVNDYVSDREYLTAVVGETAYKRTAYGWTTMAHYSPSLGNLINMDDKNIISAFSGLGLFRLVYGNAQIPTDGRTHLMDMSADGYYIYACVLNNAGQPMAFRLSYDLSEIAILNDPLAGTWGGVVCDPWYAEYVWLFGDWGAEKVLLSEDWGDTFTDMTDGAWGGGELVRPLLISDWDTDDVVVILNTATQVWQSKDVGTTWTNIGVPVFNAQCGVRDPFEPHNIWIGRASPGGANHLQYSPSEGRGWRENSGGFSANAPVTALVVIG